MWAVWALSCVHNPLLTAAPGMQGMHPCILTNFEHFTSLIANKRVVVFLDYDGTLTPIVRNPDEAFMSCLLYTSPSPRD